MVYVETQSELPQVAGTGHAGLLDVQLTVCHQLLQFHDLLPPQVSQLSELEFHTVQAPGLALHTGDIFALHEIEDHQAEPAHVRL